jgi:hypothetical protein
MSRVFERLRKGSTETRASPTRDRRVDARHAASIEVCIQVARHCPPIAGTVINISLGGAAISVHERAGVDVTAWLARLDQNQELWLTGLLDSDVPCWVVVVDGHVLRVHFIDDDSFRDRLHGLIDRLPRA